MDGLSETISTMETVADHVEAFQYWMNLKTLMTYTFLPKDHSHEWTYYAILDAQELDDPTDWYQPAAICSLSGTILIATVY